MTISFLGIFFLFKIDTVIKAELNVIISLKTFIVKELSKQYIVNNCIDVFIRKTKTS